MASCFVRNNSNLQRRFYKQIIFTFSYIFMQIHVQIEHPRLLNNVHRTRQKVHLTSKQKNMYIYIIYYSVLCKSLQKYTRKVWYFVKIVLFKIYSSIHHVYCITSVSSSVARPGEKFPQIPTSNCHSWQHERFTSSFPNLSHSLNQYGLIRRFLTDTQKKSQRAEKKWAKVVITSRPRSRKGKRRRF